MATMADLEELALALPETAREVSDDGRPAYTVHGKAFVFHRGQRGDAVDPETGERLDDVLMFRVGDLDEKQIRLADDRGIYFTTPHFNNYPGGARADPRPRAARPRGAQRSRRRGLADAGAEAGGEGLAGRERSRRRLAFRRMIAAGRIALLALAGLGLLAVPIGARVEHRSPPSSHRREADRLPGQAQDRDAGLREAPLRASPPGSSGIRR